LTGATFEAISESVRDAGLPDAVLRTLAPDRLHQDLDYVVWYSKNQRNAYLAAPFDGRLVAVHLQPPVRPVSARVAMCNICCTLHPAGGVGLWTARRRSPTGSVVGEWICRRFECADYVGPGATFPPVSQLPETITAELRRQRLRSNLAGFLGAVLCPTPNS
jgi:FBP C-terminal treble-clef zinc-finger